MQIRTAIAAAVVVAAALPLGYAGFQAASGGDDAKPVAESASAGAAKTPAPPLGLPRLSIPADNPITPEKVELGRMLYFDKRVSKDGTVACATCHDPKTGWAEHEPTSTGIDGQVGGRNSPTVINAAYADAQFWDGRAKTLEDQAVGPVANPIEMGSSMPAVVEKLNKIPGYRERFQKVFGTPVTEKGFAQAIAAFERTILSGNSAFDRYKAGDADALNAAQKRGFEKFRKAGCAGCHAGELFSDYGYYNSGVDVHKDKPDVGRKEVTKDDEDTGAFRTPSLRDVARTAPYFHDGSAKTLEDAVALMAAGGKDNPHRSAQFNRVRRAKLSEADQNDLVAFLKALNGDVPTVEPPKLPE
jgi:cytochrome c peroxidase